MEGKRKRCEIESSTPMNERREVVLVPLDDSPIEGTYSGLEQGDQSSSTSSTGDVISSQKNRAGISNELDTTGITPTKELSSGTFDSNMFWGADNLTRAGVGKMNEFDDEILANAPNPITNWFANKRKVNEYTAGQQVIAGQISKKNVEDYSMEVVEEERKPKLILGSKAGSILLSERGCVNAHSPKRQLSFGPATPMKRYRSSSLVVESASPALTGAQGLVEDGKKIKKRSIGGKEGLKKPQKAVARAKKSDRREKSIGSNQPRINSLFMRLEYGEATEGVEMKNHDNDVSQKK